ncbi:MAG TPA: hypothetical protein EYH34_04625 [Planctomycetes bacterium]|nr:hypothetical protein [Planctomycetota bacterium]
MTQKELNRAVAKATGESVRIIATRGFHLVEASPDGGWELFGDEETDPESKILDWDLFETERQTALA